MNLIDFWPAEQNVLDCIKPEAENFSDAVFLAVHQPMQLERRRFDSSEARSGTESDLLDDFLRTDLPTGTLLLPILGNSGIGKSHLVRWLHVQLRQRSDRDTRHVIRIPKSSSLKTVLGRILKDLEGPRYNRIREQLQSAREQMDDIQATERIRAELLTAIKRRKIAAERRKANARETGGAVDPEDEKWIAHGDDKYLPSILSDPVTSSIFMGTHEGRAGIIVELARHITQDTSVETAPRRQFEAADFHIPDDVASEIAKDAGGPARRYLRRLERSDSPACQEAVELLNDIVDDAIAPLATPADTSLSELFYAVRRELLAEGRELVLLVEDFAVLAGIQGALLDAMIREGIRGEQEACVMRTALAVTEGYFRSFETVRTRASHAWHINEVSETSESATVDRVCSFVGAYLNAARFGATDLARQCSPDAVDRSWLQEFPTDDFDDDSSLEQLHAFGLSPDGRPLFPFNRNAIEELCDWRLRDADGRLRFNPRAIINGVLVAVLREYRSVFERGEFPPKDFLSYENASSLNVDAAGQVDDRFQNAAVKSRLKAFIRFWGGDPRDLSDAGVPKAAFEAFGLPVPDDAPKTLPPSQKPVGIPPTPQHAGTGSRHGPVPPPEPEQPVATTPKEPVELADWNERLEKWANGQSIVQRDANQLRSMIVDAVLAAIDWDAQLLRPLSSKDTTGLQEWVYLPDSRGASQCTVTNAMAVVATDEDFEDSDKRPHVVRTLRAVIRFHHYKSWNFDTADDDFALYANLIDRLIPQAMAWVRSSYRKVYGDPVNAIASALLIGNRILNTDSAHSREDAALVSAVFETSDTPLSDGTSPWETLRRECRDNREALKEELLLRIGARQGGAASVYGIDANRLLAVIQQVRISWTLEEEFPDDRSGNVTIGRIRSHVRDLSRRLESAVRKRRDEILQSSSKVLGQLGTDEKQVVVADLGEVIEMVRQHGAKAPADNLNELRKLVDAFRDAAISKCLQHAQRIEEQTEGGTLLSALAQIDETTLTLAVQFVDQLGAFLDRTAKKVQAELTMIGKEPVTAAVEAVDSRLRQLQVALPGNTERVTDAP